MDEYLTTYEAAAELGVSYREVMDRIKKQELPAVRRSGVYFVLKTDVARMKNVQ